MGKDYITKINDTAIYAEKMFYRNFTELGNVNGREELKF